MNWPHPRSMNRLVVILLLASASAQTGMHRAVFTPHTTLAVNLGTCEHVFNGAQTLGCPFNSNVTISHKIVVFCTNWSSAALATPTISDAQQVLTYTSLGTSGLNTGNSNSQMWAWSATTTATGALTPTCDFQAGHEGNYKVDVIEYALSNIDASVSFSNVGNATASLTANVTTTHTTTLLMYCSEPTSDTSLNVSTPSFTSEILTAGIVSAAASDKANMASGANSATCTRTPSGSPLHAGLIGLY